MGPEEGKGLLGGHAPIQWLRMLSRLRRLEISLAAKCQILFGEAVVLIIASALAVPWHKHGVSKGQRPFQPCPLRNLTEPQRITIRFDSPYLHGQPIIKG